WDADSGKQLVKMTGRTNMAYKVALSADGTRLSSGGRTRWDLRTGRGMRLTPAPTDKGCPVSSPDGRFIAIFSPNSSVVTILEVPSGRTVQTLTTASNVGSVQRLTFSADSA